MREADGWAIGERGIPSLELMETAGQAVAEAVAELSPQGPVRIVCGKGNNAGDGIVAARHLLDRGFESELILRRLAEMSEKMGTLVQVEALRDLVHERYPIGGTQRTVREMLEAEEFNSTRI